VIEFDTVVIGIAKVKSFADPMVGGAVKGYFCRKESAKGVGKGGAGRVEDGNMVEPCGTGRGRRTAKAFPRVEADVVMVSAGREEYGTPAVALGDLEAEHIAVEAERAIKIGDFEVNVANPGGFMDR
jgi:hypothetical protein